MSQINVLYVNPNSEIGGADLLLLNLIRTLDRSKFNPVVVLPFPGPLSRDFEVMGVEVEYVPLSVIKRSLHPTFVAGFVVRLLVSSLHLARLIRKRQIHLVHSNSLYVLNGAIAARLADVPAVWHVREIVTRPKPMRSLLVRLAVVLADRVLVMSDAVGEMFPAGSRASGKVVTLYDGVDLQAFDASLDGRQTRASFGIPPQAPVVGFVGRLVPWKGADVFIRACAQVAEHQPEARFLLVGARMENYREYADGLQTLAKERGLDERVIFLFDRRDVPNLLRAMDVIVHTSILPEPFGMVILEAMAMGKPVIATNAGGVPEIIKDPSLGRLVPPGDIEATAQAILALLQDRHKAQSLGQAGRRRVEECFQLETATRKVEQVYFDLLEENATTGPRESDK